MSNYSFYVLLAALNIVSHLNNENVPPTKFLHVNSNEYQFYYSMNSFFVFIVIILRLEDEAPFTLCIRNWKVAFRSNLTMQVGINFIEFVIAGACWM